MAKKKTVLWGRVFAFLGILLTSLVVFLISSNSLPSTTFIRSLLTPRAAAVPKPINVLEIRYYPLDPTGQEAKTATLSTKLAAAIMESSKAKGYKNTAALPYSQVSVKSIVRRNKQTPMTTGTGETWYESLKTIMTGDGADLCSYIVANKIDQVWIWKDVRSVPVDNGGFDQEFFMSWSNAIIPPAGYTPLCNGQRSFLVLGLDQNRLVDQALHSFGHSIEVIAEQVEGKTLYWTKWAGGSAWNTPARICGNIHYPPNGGAGAGIGYDYGNVSNVTTTCENWKPDGTGTATSVNCTRWGCNEGGYIKWWLQNAPNENNGLTYAGRAIPNWWDLLSDTDAAVANAAANGQYMVGNFLDTARTSTMPSVSKVAQDTGATLTLNPTVSGTNTLLLIAASYRSPLSTVTDASNRQQIDTIVLTNSAGTKTITSASGRINRSSNGQYATELWYVKAPATGANTVKVNFIGAVEDQIVTATSFNGVNQTTPFASMTGLSANGVSATPSLLYPSTASQIVFGVASTYVGTANDLNVTTASRGVWRDATTNVIGKGAFAPGSSTASLSWMGTESWPWSVSGVAINLVSNATATPPIVTPVAAVTDIKIGTSNGPFTVAYNGSVTLTWTSTPASTTCVASGAWTGTKTASGSLLVAGLTSSRTFTITCNGVADSINVVVTPPVTDIKIGTSDGPVTVAYNGSISLTWTSTPASTTCVASGAWTGTKTSPGTLVVSALKANATYTITCNGVSDSISIVVPLPPTAPIVDIKADGLDRVSGRGQFTTVLSWKTVGATSCKALGGWTGVKPVNGSQTVTIAVYPAKPVTKNFVLQCVNAAGSTWYDNVFVVVEQINTIVPETSAKIFVNGYDDTLMATGSGVFGAGVQQKMYLAKGTVPTLTAEVVGLTCTAPWITTPLGSKLPTAFVQPAISATTTYSMTCLDYRSVARTVSATANVR